MRVISAISVHKVVMFKKNTPSVDENTEGANTKLYEKIKSIIISCTQYFVSKNLD